MEDNYILMVSKGKGLYPDIDNDQASVLDDIPMYEYLENKCLIVPSKKEKFLEEVRGLYHMYQDECFDKYGEIITPSQETISDLIDEENETMIAIFLRDESEKADNIFTLYTTRVSAILPFKVEEALNTLGLPYSDTEDNKTIIRRSKVNPYYDEFQLRMFGDELYE